MFTYLFDPMKSVLFILLALLTSTGLQAQDAATRLNEALSLERSVGDYEGAIAIYREIAGDASADRRVVGRAVLQLGKAYESLGRTEAFAAYERVARDFGDQEDLVAEARERMRGLAVETAPSTEGVGPWNVNPVLLDWGVNPSDDGQYVVGVDTGVMRMAYHRNGDPTLNYISPIIGERGEVSASDGYPSFGRFSPDNGQIAYAFFGPDTDGYQLVIWDLTTGNSRVLLDTDYVEVYDWSHDGRYVLAWVGDGLARIEAATGATAGAFKISGRVFEWNLANHCFMGDRLALYDSVSLDRREIRVVDFEAGTDQPLEDSGANVQLLGCDDDRGVVAVKSDLLGTTKASLHQFDSGRLIGERVALPVIPPEAGSARLVAGNRLFWTWDFSADRRVGTFPYSKTTQEVTGPGDDFNVVDPGRFPLPGWSRDGLALAFTRFRARLLVVEDGQERVLDPQPVPLHMWRWSADRSAFIIAAPNQGTVRMDAASGVISDRLDGLFGAPGRSGTTILATRLESTESVCLDEYDGGLSSRVTLFCYYDDLGDVERYIELSPDGTKALIAAHPREGGAFLDSGIWQPRMALRLSIADLRAKKVETLLENEFWQSPAWLPGNAGILIQKQDGTLESIALNGERQLWLSEVTDQRRLDSFRPHPTEDKIWLSTSSRDEERETRQAYYVTELAQAPKGGQD